MSEPVVGLSMLRERDAELYWDNNDNNEYSKKGVEGLT